MTRRTVASLSCYEEKPTFQDYAGFLHTVYAGRVLVDKHSNNYYIVTGSKGLVCLATGNFYSKSRVLKNRLRFASARALADNEYVTLCNVRSADD